jgi:hypothetical protein
MPCDHKLFEEHLCDYIEGRTPPGVRVVCDEALRECAHCREVHARALELYEFGNRWQEQAVPEWNRARFAIPPVRTPGTRLTWIALAASFSAVALVLLRVEVSTANGLWISFGGSQTDARVQELVAAELELHVAEQDLLLDARLEEFATDQLSASQLLLARWHDAARAERRQELGLLVSNWQTQRFDDRQEINAQLAELANGQIENNQYLNAMLQNSTLSRRNGL